jgi:hypothetical protein
MKRREIMGLTGVSICSLGTPGCLTNLTATSSPSRQQETLTLPDGMTIETVSTAGISHCTVSNDDSNVSCDKKLIVTTHEEAIRKLSPTDAEAETFIEQTDFRRSYLVSVMDTGSPDDQLRVDGIRRTQTGLQMDLSVVAPGDTYRESMRMNNIIVRITDEKGEVPGSVSVDITDRV